MSQPFDRFMVDIHIGANLKLHRLTPPERWCYVAGVFSIAAQAPIRGCLVIGDEDARPEDYAQRANVTKAVAATTLDKLRALGMIEIDPELGCERVHDWDEYQPKPKTDRTNADRQRRWKDRNGGSNGTSNAVTNGLVTPGREEKRREDTSNVHTLLAESVSRKTAETISILSQVPRWVGVDPVGVENVEAAFPNADLIAGARLAVTWGVSPDWRLPAVASLRKATEKLEDRRAAGRSKAERGADGVAAITRLMEGHAA